MSQILTKEISGIEITGQLAIFSRGERPYSLTAWLR